MAGAQRPKPEGEHADIRAREKFESLWIPNRGERRQALLRLGVEGIEASGSTLAPGCGGGPALCTR